MSSEDEARLERIRSIIIQRLSMDAADVSLRDAAIVRWAASLVANRAAKLSGSAVAAIMVQTGHAQLGGGYVPKEERFVIGVDGRWGKSFSHPNVIERLFILRSLIEHYPNFNARMRESVRVLIGTEVERKIQLGMAKDGSGVGGMSFLMIMKPCLLSFIAALGALQATKRGH